MQPASPAARRARERLAQGLVCDVRGCYLPVSALSRFCSAHDKRNETTGHPLGRTITKGELRPFKERAAAFIQKHADHPGIRAAVDWLARLIATAEAPRYVGPSSTAEQRLARWLERMRREGVDPRDILATVAGMYLLRAYRPGAFKSDRHADHQLALRVLRLVPAPHVERWSGSKVRRRYDRVGVAVREHLAKRLNVAFGLLCLRISRALLAEMTAPDPDRLPDQSAPFN